MSMRLQEPVVEKITYIRETGKVIYHTKPQKGKNKKNFTIFTVEEFIAAITQHIPKKSFQMTRYYGWYSNKSRGIRSKSEEIDIEGPDNEIISNEVEVIDISKYRPQKVPSLTWRECIKKIWKNDPLICPECSSVMKIISFIEKPSIIKKILKYLNLWDDERNSRFRKSSRDPPTQPVIKGDVV